MTSATVTPMLSEDGGSPPTKQNTPLAPTCRPSVPFWALTGRGRVDVGRVDVAELLARERHRRVGDGAVGADAGLAEVGHAPPRASGDSCGCSPCPAALVTAALVRRLLLGTPAPMRVAERGVDAGDAWRRGSRGEQRCHGRLGGRVVDLAGVGLPDDLALEAGAGARTAGERAEQVLRGRGLGVRAARSCRCSRRRTSPRRSR